MFYFLLGVLLGCTPDKEATGDSVDSSVLEEESPIHWDECSYRIGEHICNVSLPDSDMGEFALMMVKNKWIDSVYMQKILWKK